MSQRRGKYYKAGEWKSFCLQCGKEMIFNYHCHMISRKFCSNVCSNQCADTHKRPASLPKKEVELVCKCCGRTFQSRNPVKSICSRSCQGLWMNSKRSKFICTPWTVEENTKLANEYPICLQPKKLAESMNRSCEMLVHQVKRLGLERTPEAISEGYALGGRKNKGNKRPDFKKNMFVGKGEENPFFGKTHSIEARKVISEKAKKTGTFKRLSKCPTFQKKRMMGLHARPNHPELIISEILDRLYPGEYKYTGSGDFIIDGLNPDFVNVNGQKKIIEVFGEQYHDPEVSIRPVGYRATEEGRREVFAEFGYEMLVIWSKQIYRGGVTGRKKLEKSIKEFHENLCD